MWVLMREVRSPCGAINSKREQEAFNGAVGDALNLTR